MNREKAERAAKALGLAKEQVIVTTNCIGSFYETAVHALVTVTMRMGIDRWISYFTM